MAVSKIMLFRSVSLQNHVLTPVPLEPFRDELHDDVVLNIECFDTHFPSEEPTQSPTDPTEEPTEEPTGQPSEEPRER